MTETDHEKIEINDETVPEESAGGVPVTQQLLLLGGIFVLIFGSALSSRLISGIIHNNDDDPESATGYIEEEPVEEEELEIKPFAEVEILANAAYVFDVQNQRALYRKNESESLPLASVTKLMTALVAHEILDEDADVAITNKSIIQDGDSGLLDGEVFGRTTLTDLVLMSSSNDGAYALAVKAGDALDPNKSEVAFVQAMNIRAEELELHETEFMNPTGLDLSTTKAGAYGSARDMVFLMEHIISNSPEILAFTKESSAQVYSESGQRHNTENTNYYIDEIPGIIGSKTGYTDLAGGNLVIAYNAGLARPIVIAVLGSTQVNRFTDVLKLIEETNTYIANE